MLQFATPILVLLSAGWFAYAALIVKLSGLLVARNDYGMSKVYALGVMLVAWVLPSWIAFTLLACVQRACGQ